MATTVFRNEILNRRHSKTHPAAVASPAAAGALEEDRRGVAAQFGVQVDAGEGGQHQQHAAMGNEEKVALRIVLAGEPAGKAVAVRWTKSRGSRRPADRRASRACRPCAEEADIHALLQGSVRLRRDVAAIGDDGGGAPRRASSGSPRRGKWRRARGSRQPRPPGPRRPRSAAFRETGRRPCGCPRLAVAKEDEARQARPEGDGAHQVLDGVISKGWRDLSRGSAGQGSLPGASRSALQWTSRAAMSKGEAASSTVLPLANTPPFR